SQRTGSERRGKSWRRRGVWRIRCARYRLAQRRPARPRSKRCGRRSGTSIGRVDTRNGNAGRSAARPFGASVPLLANPGAQNCPHPKLDGILLEGWPVGLPAEFLDFDTGLARYFSWAKKGGGLTIANGLSSKFGFGTIGPGDDEKARTDYVAMRF